MSWSDQDGRREAFGRLADVLIPAERELPSATEAQVEHGLVDQALSYRPDLEDAFERALGLATGADPVADIERLSTEHPDEFAALSLVTTGAYYLSPRVRELLNYRQGEPRPARDDLDTYADLLEAVMEREPPHRHHGD